MPESSHNPREIRAFVRLLINKKGIFLDVMNNRSAETENESDRADNLA